MTERSIRPPEPSIKKGVEWPPEGIRDRRTAEHGIICEMPLRPSQMTTRGGLRSSVVMALADHAVQANAPHHLPEGTTVETIEASVRFLGNGGDLLQARSSPLRVGPDHSLWRVDIGCNGEPVAEVTQTLTHVRQSPANVPTPSLTPDHAPTKRSMVGSLDTLGSGQVVDLRRRQIFEAACAVIGRKGFAKATIREIAAAAEMPVPTMYQYLERKEDLLYGIYEYFMGDIVASLQTWRSATAPPRRKLEGVLRTMIDAFDKNHKYIKIMFQETRALMPEDRRKVFALDAQYIAILSELLNEAEGEGQGGLAVGDRELAANLVYFLCVIWPLRYWTIGKFGEAAVTDEIIAFALRGLGMIDGNGRADAQPKTSEQKEPS